MYRYAIIGFGGLGKLHLINLLQLEVERKDIKLCAVCGADKETVYQSVSLNIGSVDMCSVDFSDCNFYTDYKILIDEQKPDFVVSALPTNLHEEVAVYALERGCHVFSEKPMALSLDECDKMIAAAKDNNKKLMIGHVLRFSPPYVKLKEYIDNETFGIIFRYEFSRYFQTPLWTWNNWILDPELSGGCILDMHIHDVDLMNWYFGKPNSVYSVGTDNKNLRESIVSIYKYDNLLVHGSADWSMTQKYPFSAKCLANFERATVVIENGSMIVYTDDEIIKPELDFDNGHYYEMEMFLKMIADDIDCDNVTTPESVRESVSIFDLEMQSLNNMREVFIGV